MLTREKAHLGLLAYGSLIDDQGQLSVYVTQTTKGVPTPFKVEFARSSPKRWGGPTLIPVVNGGAGVSAVLFTLNSNLEKSEAKNMLWRREAGRVSGCYVNTENPSKNKVVIKELIDFHHHELVLYTSIGSNIKDISGLKLAQLAIDSARHPEAIRGEEGISYLIRAKKAGIETPLTEEFENELLRITGSTSLEEALERVISGKEEAR